MDAEKAVHCSLTHATIIHSADWTDAVAMEQPELHDAQDQQRGNFCFCRSSFV